MIQHQLDQRIGKMLEVLEEKRLRRREAVQGIEASVRGADAFAHFENGAIWADEWVDFRCALAVPEDFRGKVLLSAVTSRENLWEAVNPQMEVIIDGRFVQAFDTRHHEAVLMDEARPGARFEVLLRAYCPAADAAKGEVPPRLWLYLDDVLEDVQQLIYDVRVPWEAACLLPEGDRTREQTLYAISDALNQLDLRSGDEARLRESVAAARECLQERIYRPLKGRPPKCVADCIGHTHIDVAWLWDLYQTRHKAARSFATMLNLMQRYPEFKFMSSQAQLYQFVKEDHPALFERIRQAVARGQWEVEGGMWVEADCNLSGGEALVRQILYGNEFFMKEFGKRSRILWLPDVFGYSAALPQILKKSGIDYFMTSKLSWSEYNLYPYDTFEWKGIDGSEVLTHFTPTRDCAGKENPLLSHFTTYNAMLGPDQLEGGWRRFQQKGLDDHFLVTYGYGDGGGGPTDWMIENARRMAQPLCDAPVARQTFARDFFEQLEARVAGDPRLPKWSGELYLEYHRGTYTAMAKNKRNNRKLEIALREMELWCECVARRLGRPYPQERAREIWRQMLTLQFHDILPGSSIKKVYDDADASYEKLFAEVEALTREATSALAGGDLTLFNSLSAPRSDVVRFEAPAGATALRGAAGTFPLQRVGDACVAYVEDLPPMAAAAFEFVRGEEAAPAVRADAEGFETPFFAGRFDGAMRITSLYDKRAGRELVKPGQALNRIVCYENRPHAHDAWDINIYYGERKWEVDGLQAIDVLSEGPVATVLRARYAFNRSTIWQDIWLYRDLPRIDFETKVDWQEDHYLLKAHFPADVFYNEATFDIQYGNVKRPTHKNTSWDVARFEVCAHKWMDVSEPGYGASVFNDCKYGCSVDEDGMALTLLKSSTHPNPEADRGTHVFSYSLAPHLGDWRAAQIPQAAYRFNIPVLTAIGAGGAARAETVCCVDAPNVLVESVKRGLFEDVTVVRLYECHGQRTRAAVRLPGAQSAHRASLMEDQQEEIALVEGAAALEFKPYEIVTLLVR